MSSADEAVPVIATKPQVRMQLPRDWRSQTGMAIVLIFGATVMLVPFFWMIATSLSRKANSSMPRVPTLWPADPSLFNYWVATANLPIVKLYINSLFIVGTTTLGYLLFSSIAGYAFAKGRFPGKTFLFIVFLATLFIPFETRMIPLYLFVRDLHLNNTYWALILPFLAGGFGTFLMRQTISTIPDDLIDAARIDGASEFRIFWSIVLPLCKPTLATLAIINVIWRWNDVLWPLLVTSSRDLYTVTQGLALAGKSSGVYVGVALATAVMAILPVIVAYLFLQRYVIRSVVSSGVKG
ncbi:MAG: carbohydrate ABC transporter permease [Devosia sp.]|uniref:carbohydrate ABC transporter permease n=1 Tax=Devosia sp. 66-22 TaxID=1895753 RepID=UPI000AD8A7E8|nr:carbohydrate ABC transporter permease [Devosia sp. 66-22]MBN9347903.1 carbohydrate ABC transporter permease [Devosia sp.]